MNFYLVQFNWTFSHLELACTNKEMPYFYVVGKKIQDCRQGGYLDSGHWLANIWSSNFWYFAGGHLTDDFFLDRIFATTKITCINIAR